MVINKYLIIMKWINMQLQVKGFLTAVQYLVAKFLSKGVGYKFDMSVFFYVFESDFCSY